MNRWGLLGKGDLSVRETKRGEETTTKDGDILEEGDNGAGGERKGYYVRS